MYWLSKLFGSIFLKTNMGYEELLNEMYIGGLTTMFHQNGISFVLSDGRYVNLWTGSGYGDFRIISPELRIPFLYKARVWDAVQYVVAKGQKV